MRTLFSRSEVTSNFQPMKTLVAVSLFASSLALASTASAQTQQTQGQSKPATTATTTAPKEPTGSEVVAIINGDKIMYSDVVAARRSLPAQYQQIPMASIYAQLLKQLVERHLLSQAAKAEGLEKDAVVKASIRQATSRVLSSSYARKVISTAVTDAAVKAEFDKQNKGKTGPEEIRARHILVKTEAEARAIISEIKKGADFIALAKAKSTGPSGAKGGDLGYFQKGAMVPEFSQAAFAMKKGEVSDPVKTQFGWHIIKVEDRRAAAGPSLEKESQKIREKLAREVIQKELAKQKSTAKIETFMPDGKALPLPN